MLGSPDAKQVYEAAEEPPGVAPETVEAASSPLEESKSGLAPQEGIATATPRPRRWLLVPRPRRRFGISQAIQLAGDPALARAAKSGY